MHRKFLMLDRRWMVHHHGRWAPRGAYRFKVAPPTKLDRPVIVADKPWESMTVNFASVVYDAGIYRLFYDAIDQDYVDDRDSYLCYAESDDGINWRKPELGLVEYRGSTKNNIILDARATYDVGYHAGTVFIDPTAPPKERYRIIFYGGALGRYISRRPREEWNGIDLIVTGSSPDGLHWRMATTPVAGAPAAPMLCLHSEVQRGVWWDPQLRKYVGFFITREPGYNRCIARAETSDFAEWPMPRTVLRVDDKDQVTADMYNNGAMRYESGGDVAYFLFFSMYDHESDRLNVQLATSRDSYTWFRGDRSVYIDNGPDDFDAGGIYVSPSLVPLKDKLAVFYHGASFKHEEALPDKIQYQGCVALATTPVDRFQGLHADGDFEFSLQTFTLESANLDIAVNADIKGEVRMAVTSYRPENPWSYGPGPEWVQGAGFRECVPLTGDVVDGRIRWSGRPDLRDLIGKPVELRVAMRQATLFGVEVRC